MISFRMLSTTHPEWARMWECLFDIAGSYTDHNPVSGEYWQYVGTFLLDRPPIGSLLPLQVLVHQFRHRDRAENCKPISELPNSFGRVVLQLSASVEYSGGWNSPFREGTLMFER